MCSSSPEGRTNPLTMSLTHSSSDRDSLGWQRCGRSRDSLRSVLGGFPAPVLSRGWKGRSSHGEVTLICPIAGGLLLACLPLHLCILDWQLKTVFMIRHQLAEGDPLRLKWSFRQVFSHTVPCIEALNLNNSMTRCSIYRCVANVVVFWVNANFTLFTVCTVGPAGYNIRQQAQRSTNALKTKNQDTNGETYAKNQPSHPP